ncbi:MULTISPECIES: helix-turn-helix domain-containing protein [unclassified Paenibacillus]|uniref:helix-turn-helix domain-containing protein n=2 Tax=unclassified Paenibacillus TaxID=185978 RepID=UPI00384C6B0B
MSIVMKKVGEGIRHYRKERGLSQEELAHLARINESYIGKLERAEKVCSIEMLSKLTDALEVSLSEFFRYIEPTSREGNQEITTLELIVNRLRGCSVSEQKKVLKMIDVLLEGI